MALTTPASGKQTSATAGGQGPTGPRRIGGGLLDPEMLWKSLPSALAKLDPRTMVKNPVMFVVEVGAVLSTYSAITSSNRVGFAWTIAVWLWLTVVFANLAEALAEGRGRAQAATLRAMTYR